MASEPRFFVLESEQEGPFDTASETADGTESRSAPRCPRCGEVIGMRECLPPYRVEIAVHGAKGSGDWVKSTAFERLVSERMADAFRAEGLTGLEGFHPVEVVKLNARAKRLGIPRYLLVHVLFGRAAVDEARSRLRRAEPISCTECRSTNLDGIYGFSIEPGTWEGLDVFRPRGFQGDVVVSERFAEFVRRHGFTNIKLTPTEQLIWDPLQKGPPAATALA